MTRHSRLLSIFCLLIVLAITVTVSVRPTRAQNAATPLSYGASASGIFGADGTPVSYSFNGAAHDLVTIEIVSSTDGVDPKATLLGSDGQPLMSNDNGAFSADHSAFISLFLPQSGSYTVQVSTANGADGGFSLHLTGRAPVKSHQLAFGVPVEVDVRTDPIPAYFSFKADPTCPTTLTVYDVSSGKPHTFPFVVIVRDQDGTPVEMLQGGRMTENRMTVAPETGTAPDDGLYEVEVQSADHAVFGSLMLVITCADQVPTCFAPPTPAATEAATETVPGATSTPSPEGTPVTFDPCDASEQTTQRGDGTPVIVSARGVAIASLSAAIADGLTPEATSDQGDGPVVAVERGVLTPTPVAPGSIGGVPCVPPCPEMGDDVGVLAPAREPVVGVAAPVTESDVTPEATVTVVRRIDSATPTPCAPVPPCPGFGDVVAAPARGVAVEAPAVADAFTPEATVAVVRSIDSGTPTPCAPVCPPSSGDGAAVASLSPAIADASATASATDIAPTGRHPLNAVGANPCLPTCPPSSGEGASLPDVAVAHIEPIERHIGDATPCPPICPPSSNDQTGSVAVAAQAAGDGKRDLGILTATPEATPCATDARILVVTPTATPTPVVTKVVPAQAPYNCGLFRLTSPTDGLPNGGITVYWDPAPGVTSYRVNVYNESKANVLSTEVGGGTTSVNINVSEGSIGGGFVFTVQVQALFDGQVKCSSAVTEQRASSNNGGGGGHPKPTQCIDATGLPCDA